MIADYILIYKGIKLAVVEAKSDEQEVCEGVMQAKQYAQKLQLETTYSTNGKAIYQICMKTGEEGLVTDFLSPEQLWNKTFAEQNNWREQFANVPNNQKSFFRKTQYPGLFQRGHVGIATIFALLNDQQKEFITFVLSKYIETGVDETRPRKTTHLAHKQVSIIGRCKRNFGRCGKHQQTVYRISSTSLQTKSSVD